MNAVNLHLTAMAADRRRMKGVAVGHNSETITTCTIVVVVVGLLLRLEINWKFPYLNEDLAASHGPSLYVNVSSMTRRRF